MFRPRKVLAVDVDGTLVSGSRVNVAAIEFCRRKKADGFSLMLWSAAGEDHAREVAARLEITDLFSVITSKPFFVLDDAGWSWIKYTKVIKSLDEDENPQTEN